MNSVSSEKCVALIHHALTQLEQRNFPAADRELAAALQTTRALPNDEARSCFPLTCASLCLLRLRQGNSIEATKLRAVAMKLLDEIVTPLPNALFFQLTANVLSDLQEYYRAIPFHEQAAQLLSEQNDPLGVARSLASAGNCYCRSGLNDHGAVPLRTAVKIYRDHPGDPHLPEALLNLGNALRKSSPDEAEAAYKEAAAFYESKMQLASATPAWVNLGVLCSNQNRNDEALTWYQKALRVREQAPGTPPARIGSLLNNIANCHRRTRNFAEAHNALDRAFQLLQPEDVSSLASAYGTRGLIFSDQGRDADAVVWLQKAITEHQKMPSPNLENIATELEYAVISLRRLNRLEEATAAECLLETMRKAQREFPPASLDLSALDRTADDLSSRTDLAAGAVLVEVECGLRSGTPYTVADAVKLSEQLTSAAHNELAGFYGGRVVIPESTTLMYYGEEAETLYRAFKPILDTNPLCKGARVSIRQGLHLREVSLPPRVM